MPRGVLQGEPEILGVPPYERRPGERCLVLAREGVSGKAAPAAMRWGLSMRSDPARRVLQIPFGRLPGARMASRARCLVPAGGYIQRGIRRAPIRVGLTGDISLAIAAVWESGPAGPGFAVVTTDAAQPLAPAQDRMPLLLRPEHWPLWLEERPLTASELATMARPAPAIWLRTQALRRLPETGVSAPISRQLDELIPGGSLWSPPEWRRPQPALREAANHATG
jgi:putative SOS response-associated peptidase YedK